jgi:rRNA maturation protein Rpf1
MEKISLKLHEILTLDAELNGAKNQQTGEVTIKGLANEKLSLVVKYHMNELSKKVAAEKQSVETLREELIKKLGTEEDGQVFIKMYDEVLDEEGNVVSRSLTENFLEFNKEYDTLLSEVKELEYRPFELSELASIETEANYDVFFKLIKAPTE